MAFDWGLFRQAKETELANQTRDSTSEAGLRGSQAGLIDQQAQQVAPSALAAQKLSGAQAGQIGAEADVTRAGLLPGFDDSTLDLLHGSLRARNLFQGPASAPSFGSPQYNAGTDQVPGQGDGTVDKVHAMLAPGEAVLTKTAAEKFGRDKIAAMNAAANAEDVAAGKRDPQGGPAAGKSKAGRGMIPPGGKASQRGPEHDCMGSASVGYAWGSSGVPDVTAGGRNNGSGVLQSGSGPGMTQTNGQWGNGGANTQNTDLRSMILGNPAAITTKRYNEGTEEVEEPQHFDKGTHNVQAKKSAKTPNISPGVIQALMGMMQQSGGNGGGVPAAAPGAPGRGMV